MGNVCFWAVFLKSFQLKTPFLEFTLLLFAATGNIAWSNRYHYVDILWQEDASCALSKTNTASALQHDPIKAVCTNTHTHVYAHKPAKKKKALTEVRMCTVTCTPEWTACTEKHKGAHKHGTNTRQHRVQLSQCKAPQGLWMALLSFDPPPLCVWKRERVSQQLSPKGTVSKILAFMKNLVFSVQCF